VRSPHAKTSLPWPGPRSGETPDTFVRAAGPRSRDRTDSGRIRRLRDQSPLRKTFWRPRPNRVKERLFLARHEHVHADRFPGNGAEQAFRQIDSGADPAIEVAARERPLIEKPAPEEPGAPAFRSPQVQRIERARFIGTWLSLACFEHIERDGAGGNRLLR
jgi:hypothetical protein